MFMIIIDYKLLLASYILVYIYVEVICNSYYTSYNYNTSTYFYIATIIVLLELEIRSTYLL